MIIKKTNIENLFKLIPFKKKDNRGSFHRSFCEKILKKKILFKVKQCNISINKKKGTLRGFHYQARPFRESKIITVVSGSIYNVTIDLRKNSKSFLSRNEINLSSDNNYLILIPAGCANAFLTTSENTIIHYYMNQFYEDQIISKYRGFKYDDKFFDVKWPIKPMIISTKDRFYKKFDLTKI